MHQLLSLLSINWLLHACSLLCSKVGQCNSAEAAGVSTMMYLC
jgi:hypothetical protein